MDNGNFSGAAQSAVHAGTMRDHHAHSVAGSTHTVSRPASPSSTHPPGRDRDWPMHDADEDDNSKMDDPNASQSANESEGLRKFTATTTTVRRNASGKVSSVISGNKIRFLKKADGEPFWRGDIQYNFLQRVFGSEAKVFTNVSDGTHGHSFADVYIDAMSKSSKCSQVLKEKLASDREAAVEMAMICLLVNVGRMNTTLNFFPEMRARVRTFHSIPCLQAHHGRYVKQLQDGPRLKSILKGATEDTEQPASIEAVIRSKRPRTNPVNLLFVLSQIAHRISAHHFQPKRDFYDLFMEPRLSSKSRANAFLWIMWWYLESDFTAQDALRNPFGPGIPNPEDPDNPTLPDKVPPLEELTEEEAAAENVDTPEEKEYAEAKRQERATICEEDGGRQSLTGSAARKHAYAQYSDTYQLSDPGFRSKQSPHPSISDFDRSRMSLTPPRRRHDDPDGTQSPSPAPSREMHSLRVDSLLNHEPRLAATPNGPALVPRQRGSRGKGYSRREERDSTLPRLAPATDPADPMYSVHRLGSSYGAPPQYTFATESPTSTLRQVSMPGTSVFPQRDSSKASAAQEGSALTGQGKRLRQGPSREERVDKVLLQDMRSFRHRRKQDRRRRGVVMDAWIKCRQLSDAYDSESEPEATNNASVPVRRPKGGIDDPWESMHEDLGDAGDRNAVLARVLRRTGRLLDGSSAILRSTKSTRVSNATARNTHGGRRSTKGLDTTSAAPLNRQRSYSIEGKTNSIDKPSIISASTMTPKDPSATAPPSKKRGSYKKKIRPSTQPGEGTILLADALTTSSKASAPKITKPKAKKGGTLPKSARPSKAARRSYPSLDLEGSDADLAATPREVGTPRSGGKASLLRQDVEESDEGGSATKGVKKRRESGDELRGEDLDGDGNVRVEGGIGVERDGDVIMAD